MPADAPVLVVGAGPAGATAARRLALASVRVRLLHRAPFPRHKPRGGAISPPVLLRFPYSSRPWAESPSMPSRGCTLKALGARRP